MSVKPEPPAVPLVGESELIDGRGLLIVKVDPPDVPPPGVGFVTVTVAVPAVVISLARIDAVSCVLLTNVVVRFEPFHFTEAPETKLEPLTVSVKPEPPAVPLVGESELIDGRGLLIVKVDPPDVPPPGVGLKTVTVAVPAVVISLARIDAVSCVLLTNVVVRLEPFHFTEAPETKLEPLTVSVKPEPPAVPLAGESELIDGRGLLIVKVDPPDVPPPGVGFVTVTVAVPAVVISLARIDAVSCVLLT